MDRRELVRHARTFLFKRNDLSLGIMPQALMGKDQAELWSLFWYAARVLDDAMDEPGFDLEASIRSVMTPGASTAPEEAFEAFLEDYSTTMAPDEVRTWAADILRGTAHEDTFTTPRSTEEYFALMESKAMKPLFIMNTLVFPDERRSLIERYSRALGYSIQMGDDLRDLFADMETGRTFITTEELALANIPGDSIRENVEEVIMVRLAICMTYALKARRLANDFSTPRFQRLARFEANMWVRSIVRGRVRPDSGRMKHNPLFELAMNLGISPDTTVSLIRHGASMARFRRSFRSRKMEMALEEKIERMSLPLPRTFLNVIED